MNVNPFTIRYGYHASLHFGYFQRRRFSKRIQRIAQTDGDMASSTVPMSVVTMAGSSCLSELVRCLRSFGRYAGRPKRVRVVCDGTLTTAHVRMIQAGGAQVVHLQDVLSPDLPDVVTEQLDQHWMVKKQALLMSLAQDGPELFVDADFEFFPGAFRLGEELKAIGSRPAYMPDVMPALDERMLRPDDPRDPPVNSGFLYFPQPIDWSKAVERFAALSPEAELRNTDQTMAHLALHDADAVPLARHRYILACDDQFEWRDRYANDPDAVCRHYVGPIRHKMWNRWRLTC